MHTSKKTDPQQGQEKSNTKHVDNIVYCNNQKQKRNKFYIFLSVLSAAMTCEGNRKRIPIAHIQCTTFMDVKRK